MNIDLRSYSARGWLRGQPLVHAFKSIRQNVIDRRFRALPPRASTLRGTDLNGKNILIAVAFEDAQSIEWQARLVRRYVPEAGYVVIDNSNSDAAAHAIKAVCRNQGCAYVRAPANPWPDAPSRSHGIAMNWTWEQIIKPNTPRAFGFLDDDIYPLEPTDPFAALETQDICGVVRHVGARWFLWAGFCFFRFAAVRDLPLDFGQAWFLGLDTGGANWNVLYRTHDVARLAHTPTRFLPFRPGAEAHDAPLQHCGAWIHEVGQMGSGHLAADKRSALKEILISHLE